MLPELLINKKLVEPELTTKDPVPKETEADTDPEAI